MYLSIYIYAYDLMTVPCPRYMLRAQRGQLINIILRSPFNVLHSVLVLSAEPSVVTYPRTTLAGFPAKAICVPTCFSSPLSPTSLQAGK